MGRDLALEYRSGSGSAAMLTRGFQKFLFGVNPLEASSFQTVSNASAGGIFA
jgi:hypothetical protein